MAQSTKNQSNQVQPIGLLERIWQNPWLVFLLPFFVYMLAGSFEPTAQADGGAAIGLHIPYDYYPWVYTLKIALTLVAIMLVWPGYRQFPLKVSWLSIAVGIVGVVLWVVLTKLGVERYLGLRGLTELGERTAFNPFTQYESNPLAAWCFMSIRLFGLAIVVPVIEEFFLRGFIMRFFVDRDWWKVPMGDVTRAAIIAGTAVPMLMHPAELLAAAVWFSIVTWLMIRTRNIWDCVVAHMVTNGLLGVYVLLSGDWYFL
jgi:hypothetical protein